MTLFAVACAGMFPLLHLGRPWLLYWLFPTIRIHVDVAAVSQPVGMGRVRGVDVCDRVAAILVRGTGAGISPRCGIAPEDTGPGEIVYGMFAMGWRGSAIHWKRYETASMLLAGLATPLVVSVHTVVSFDFAVGIVPGWHSTICSAVLRRGRDLLRIRDGDDTRDPDPQVLHLEDFVTLQHLDNMGKLMLATGMIVAYGYMMETFRAYYSGNVYDKYMILNRMIGPYAIVYWVLILCNIAIPQAFGRSRVRRNAGALFFVSLVVNVGMWLERFVIVVTSLHRDFTPSAWGCSIRLVGIGRPLSDRLGYSLRCCICLFATCR